MKSAIADGGAGAAGGAGGTVVSGRRGRRQLQRAATRRCGGGRWRCRRPQSSLAAPWWRSPRWLVPRTVYAPTDRHALRRPPERFACTGSPTRRAQERRGGPRRVERRRDHPADSVDRPCRRCPRAGSRPRRRRMRRGELVGARRPPGPPRPRRRETTTSSLVAPGPPATTPSGCLGQGLEVADAYDGFGGLAPSSSSNVSSHSADACAQAPSAPAPRTSPGWRIELAIGAVATTSACPSNSRTSDRAACPGSCGSAPRPG